MDQPDLIGPHELAERMGRSYAVIHKLSRTWAPLKACVVTTGGRRPRMMYSLRLLRANQVLHAPAEFLPTDAKPQGVA